jgi:beta-phosphoglucomutase-like phosphatase (HAD superfamily)
VLDPSVCVVVEDAEAGISAALGSKMNVIGVGFASSDERANLLASSLTH